MNVGNRLSESIFLCIAALFPQKILRILISCQTDTVEMVPLNFEFTKVSTKSNYGGIFSFPDRLKFGQIWTTVATLTVGNL